MWHCTTTHFDHRRQQSATSSRGSPLQPTCRSGPAASWWTACVNGRRFTAPPGRQCKRKWIWAAKASVDCCDTLAANWCRNTALTLPNISWFITERFGVCPNVATISSKSGFLALTLLEKSWCEYFGKSLLVILDSSATLLRIFFFYFFSFLLKPMLCTFGRKECLIWDRLIYREV